MLNNGENLVDTIRVGRAREIKIAIEELEKRLQYA